MKKISKIIIATFVVGVSLYILETPLLEFAREFEYRYFPCTTPITYRLGTFDTRFGITKEQFLQSIKTAETMWEKPIGKQLFLYDPKGSLVINLMYDDRQAATETLKRIGFTVSNDRASYDALKVRYEALKTEYQQALSVFNQHLALFEQQKREYETQVAYWNERGGAPKSIYAELQLTKQSLDQSLSNINAEQAVVNSKVNAVNAAVTVLNQLAQTLNIQASLYNQVGKTQGGEFEEGLYERSGGATSISIYEFSSNQKLVRVLAHELGHALGLEHVDDPAAIMYRLNQSNTEKLSASDLSSLKALCRIK